MAAGFARTGGAAGRGLVTGRRQNIDVEAFLEEFQSGGYDWIDVDCYGMRLEYFAAEKDLFANTFPFYPGEEIHDDEIAINIRTGDIIGGVHWDYTPLPIAYYHRVIFETGLKPVFVGQVSGNWYAAALRQQFPAARFVEGSVLSDFQTIRGAKAVMAAVSSFSWLASFLSTAATQIHLPVAGLFNPQQRPDVDLLPFTDKRYRFHWFPPAKYAADSRQQAIISSPPAWAQKTGSLQATYLGYREARPQPRILSSQEAGDKIRSAAKERRPFCFVCLGGGEGGLLKLSPSTADSAVSGDFPSQFGSEASVDTMLAIKDGLDRTLGVADLIGIRDDIWLANDYVSTLSEQDPDFFQKFLWHFPLRAGERNEIDEHGARRIFRLFEWARESYPAPAEACSKWVGYELAMSGFWDEFLRAQETIALIHPSPDLPAKLGGIIGVRVESFLVPDAAAGQEPHDSAALSRVRGQLQENAAGKVFLVGAGPGGKEYLKIVKDNGGIALDLGELLDAWDGRQARA